MAKAPINVSITGDYNDKDIKRAIKDLQSLQKDAGQTGQSMSGFSKMSGIAMAAVAAGAATAGYALLDLGKDAVMAASDFDEVQNKVQQVFGGAAQQQMNDWADGAAKAFGLSRTAALDAASQIGIFGQSAGLVGQELQTFSTELVQLGGDLASFNNTTVDEALQALGAGLRGESEPLRRFGVLLDDATLKARAMEMGIYDGSGALSQQQRVLAAQAEILAQTTTQQGDFARTSDGLANTMRVLQAEMENVKIEIGEELLKAVMNVIDAFGGTEGLVEIIRGALGPVISLADGIGELSDQMAALGISKTGGTAAKGLDLVAESQKHLGTNLAVWDVPGQLADIISNVRWLTDENYKAAKRQEALRIAVQNTHDSLPGYISSVYSAAAATAELAGETATNNTRFQILAQLNKNAAWQDYKKRQEEAATATRATGAAVKKTTESFADQRKELLAALTDAPADKYAAAIEKLKENLADAEATFTNFKNSVVSSITQAFSFGDAYNAAKEAGTSFLDALKAQAEDAVGFADRIKQLVILGLSPEALQQVLAAGVTAGTGIANELIAGGATAIDETNRLVESATNAAAEVGELAASAYYGTGLKNAQDTVQGFVDDLGPDGPGNKKMQRIMDNLARSLNRESKITVTTVYRTEGSPPSTSVEPRAGGGPVNRNTPYLVGEQGPELFVPSISGTIIPNGGSGGAVSAGGAAITRTVNAGMGTNGAEVGRQIVDALKQYTKRNGPVPITVA